MTADDLAVVGEVSREEELLDECSEGCRIRLQVWMSVADS